MTLPWQLVSVEVLVCGWIVLLLLADILVPASRKSFLGVVALIGILLCAVLLISRQTIDWHHVEHRMLQVDGFSVYFQGLFLLTTAVVVILTGEFQRHLSAHLGAFYMLLFTALLGTLILSAMNDLLMLFLGLELLTFSLYIMAAYLKRDARSIEAGMKYLILGSVSSAFLVYGIALLYGACGSTSFSALRAACASGTVSMGFRAGVLLLMAGLGFKIAAVPFNFWVPDVYEGAPTPVVAMLSVGSKMAGIVALLRVLYGVFLPLAGLWTSLLAVLSAATLLYGNLAAIPQTNIKRLLGYSSIGHAGYLVMGLSTGAIAGVHAVAYYLLAYLFSTLAVFLVITVASDAIGGDALDQYNGLAKRSPFLAAAMFIGLLSLAGVPPLAGFVGKLFVLLATVESHRLWLVLLGAVNVAISLYYYLMVVKRMYLGAPGTSAPLSISAPAKFTLAMLIAGIVVIGVFQEPFLHRILLAVQP